MKCLSFGRCLQGHKILVYHVRYKDGYQCYQTRWFDNCSEGLSLCCLGRRGAKSLKTNDEVRESAKSTVFSLNDNIFRAL